MPTVNTLIRCVTVNLLIFSVKNKIVCAPVRSFIWSNLLGPIRKSTVSLAWRSIDEKYSYEKCPRNVDPIFFRWKMEGGAVVDVALQNKNIGNFQYVFMFSLFTRNLYIKNRLLFTNFHVLYCSICCALLKNKLNENTSNAEYFIGHHLFGLFDNVVSSILTPWMSISISRILHFRWSSWCTMSHACKCPDDFSRRIGRPMKQCRR